VLLAHLSDLHLGHRAYERAEAGRNVREGDVTRAFQRAVHEVIRVKPDLILLVGDIFDRPDPPPGALVALARGLEAFRGEIPSTQIFMVAGARDTPRVTLADPGALAALDPLPQVEAVTGAARSLFLKDLEAHLFLVPHGAVVRRPYPELRTQAEARWNILLAYAAVGTGPGPGLPLDLGPWDYVALGYQHQHQQVAARAYYPGSLERVGPEPWREAAQEKGFLTFDLESGRSRFHPIPGRAVVVLAPIRFPRGESARLEGKVREVMGEVPGGIEGKIVRLRIEGLSPHEVRRDGSAILGPLRDQALHLAIEVDDFQEMGEDNPLPLVARDSGFALRALRERIRAEEGETTGSLALLAEMTGKESPAGEPPGLEEELVVRELRGSALPLLGDVSMEAREGLVGWMGGDGRVLRAFSATLLKGVGILPDFPLSPRSPAPEREPGLALRLGGVREGSFWVRSGAGRTDVLLEGSGGSPRGWSLPPEGVALAWCGVGGESPESVLEEGSRLLGWVRGVQCLESLQEALLARYPALRRVRAGEKLSPQDFERLRLESELTDLGAQLRALTDVPEQVAALEAELREVRASAAELTGDLEAGTMDWHRERQDAETHLLAYRDRGKELKGRIRRLEALGPESPCPTCGRLLEETAQKVLEELREEWEALIQDGRWWRRRWEQLESKPEDLQVLEGRSLRLNARFEDCTERLERARSALREMDELCLREREVRSRLELAVGRAGSAPANGEGLGIGQGMEQDDMEPTAEARALLEHARRLEAEISGECRTRLLHRGGRRLNRLTGGRILGLGLEGEGGEVQLVEGGTSAGMEADEDRAAAVVALRMALAELLAEDWSPLGSLVLGDPFDRMGEEDQMRALPLLRRILSRIPQILLLTRGSVVERAPEFFDGLYEFREEPRRGIPPLRSLPAGVGVLRIR
jgi:hypothetical protein